MNFKDEIERLKKENQKLRDALLKAETLSTQDELTGLLNRRGFCSRLESFFEEALFVKKNHFKKRSFEVSNLSVLFIDVDGFKGVNDTYGHLEGDIILKEVSDFIERGTRSLDFSGRYGGDEFVVALPGAREHEAFSVAEKIRRKVEKKLSSSKGITLSIGVASLRETESKNSDDLISFSDKAMYFAKKKCGKNRTITFSNSLNPDFE